MSNSQFSQRVVYPFKGDFFQVAPGTRHWGGRIGRFEFFGEYQDNEIGTRTMVLSDPREPECLFAVCESQATLLAIVRDPHEREEAE